jgi:hypothetical protein
MSPKSKSASSAAGEFVREEIHHIRKGKHGARSTEQAIAIGLSKARRAGVRLKAPRSGPAKKQAEKDLRFAREGRAPDPKRSRGALKRLKRASKTVASHASLSRHARKVARRKKH